MLGSTDDLHHQLADELPGGRMLQQLVGLCAQGNGHAVEGHVPHGLLPACLVILYDAGLDARSAEVGGHLLNEGFASAGVVSQVDLPVALMVHAAWLRLCRTDECQSGSEL